MQLLVFGRRGQTGIGAAHEFSRTFLVKFLILGMGEQFKM